VNVALSHCHVVDVVTNVAADVAGLRRTCVSVAEHPVTVRGGPPARWVAGRATPPAVAVAVAAYLASLAALTLSDAQVAAVAPGFSKPDLTLGYGHVDVVAAFALLGEEGRRAYGINLVIDSVMPLALAVATILVAARAAPRLLPLLAVAPLVFVTLDVAENAAFGVMLLRYPDVSTALVAVVSPITAVKLAAFVVTLPTLVLGVAALAVGWGRSRRRSRRPGPGA
jgi:hypothetical protein